MCESNTSVDCRGTRIATSNSVFRDRRPPFLRTAILLVLIGVWGVFSSPSAQATVLSVSFNGTASGMLGETPFNNTPFVWTITYDTASYSSELGADQPIFLNPISVIKLEGVSTPVYVTEEHGLWVYDTASLWFAPIWMSGPNSRYDMVRIQGYFKWNGFTAPYQADYILPYPDTWFNTAYSILTDQGLLQFTSGTVTSVLANTPYLAWAARINWNGGDSSPGGDPDHDRVVNLMEYALGGNPVSALSAPRPLPQVSADNMLEITFLRAGPGLTYTVQASSDLINWSEILYTPVAVGGTQVVSDTANLADNPRRFLRLRVSAQ